MVEIRSIAREPGQRSKVAVAALQPGVDPVGACVGIRGVRIQAIVRELNDEKIDVIEWNPDPAIYIAKALSPARVTGVYLNEHSKGAKTATVVVPEDQLSLAIGRDGQNARLAAKLTAWRIDIKSLPEAASDALYKIQNDPEYALIAEQETTVKDQVIAILAKKAEGRPVQPEEYQLLSQFVDRVEKGLSRQRQKEKQVEEERQKVIQAQIPDEAYKIPLEELGISPRITSVLGGAGYTTVGDLMLQMKLDSDTVLGLSGIGPKTMEDIETALAGLTFEAPEELAAVTEAVEAQPEVIEMGEAQRVEAEAESEIELPETTLEVEVVAEVAAEGMPAEPVAEAQPVEVEAVTEAAEEFVEKPLEEAAPVLEAQVVAEAVEGQEEEPTTLDEIFALRPDALEYTEPIEDEEEDEEDSQRKKKKKKKKKFVEVEYDPEQDVVIYKKKRKRGGPGEWGDNWEI
jgi:N utilization substance protein A